MAVNGKNETMNPKFMKIHFHFIQTWNWSFCNFSWKKQDANFFRQEQVLCWRLMTIIFVMIMLLQPCKLSVSLLKQQKTEYHGTNLLGYPGFHYYSNINFHQRGASITTFKHHREIFCRSQCDHTLLCLHRMPRSSWSSWQMKGFNVFWGQTSKTMVSHGGKDSVARANRGFHSCHRDLELDLTLSLYSVLFHCMLDLAFKYHSSQSWGNQQISGWFLCSPANAVKQMSSIKSLDNIVNKI